MEEQQAAVIGDYSIGKSYTIVGKTIGKGTFGKVKLGTHVLTGEKVREPCTQVAIKILEKSRILEEADNVRVSRQLQILRSIRHPNIIQLYQVAASPKQIISTPTKLFLIMEYADGGELFELIVKNQRQRMQRCRLDEFQASKYLQQIINAVEYLHRMGIAHRDLKPENLLLDFKHNIKVVDFGLSNLYTEPNRLMTACGSPCYAAPEMISGLVYDGLKTDLWSCGIILYAMLCGYLPFEDPDTTELYRKIKACEYEMPNTLSLTARDLLTRLMHKDPEKRATIDAVRKHMFCLKKEVPVRGIIPNEYTILPEQQLLHQIEEYDIDAEQTRDELMRNKHNRHTATYYLMLKQWLAKDKRTLLDYFRQKEKDSQTGQSTPLTERTPARFRKRNLQSIQKSASKELRPITRDMRGLDSKDIGRRISQELTKHTSRELSKANSRNNFQNPIARLTDRPLPGKLSKKPAMLDTRRPLRSRTRMKSEIESIHKKKPQQDMRRLVEIIDKRLTRLNINVDRVGRPLILMPQAPKPSPTPIILSNVEYLNTDEDDMLRRIYRKNIGKLHNSPDRRLSKNRHN